MRLWFRSSVIQILVLSVPGEKKTPNTLLTKHQAMIGCILTAPVTFCSEKYSWVNL